MTLKRVCFCLAGCTGISISLWEISVFVYMYSTINSTGPCTVTSTEITTRHVRGISYRPIVRYSYVVDRVSYNGHVLGLCSFGDEFGSSHGPKSWADDILSRYPVGGQSTIYYNSADPRICVLDKSISGSWLFLNLYSTAIGMLFLHAGIKKTEPITTS